MARIAYQRGLGQTSRKYCLLSQLARYIVTRFFNHRQIRLRNEQTKRRILYKGFKPTAHWTDSVEANEVLEYRPEIIPHYFWNSHSGAIFTCHLHLSCGQTKWMYGQLMHIAILTLSQHWRSLWWYWIPGTPTCGNISFSSSSAD